MQQRINIMSLIFSLFSEFELGGGPPDMDAVTLIENYSNFQMQAIK